MRERDRTGSPLDAHLSEDAILAYCLANDLGEPPAGPSDAESAHLRGCTLCASRVDETSLFLELTRDDGRAMADAAFTDGFLARQREEVLRHIEALSRPARVITFPRAVHSGSISRRTARRWISAAAVAGLVLGATAGRLLELPSSGVRRTAQARVSVPSATDMTDSPLAESAERSSAPSMTDDEDFLVEVDMALNTTRVHELQAIDALTPHLIEASSGPR